MFLRNFVVSVILFGILYLATGCAPLQEDEVSQNDSAVSDTTVAVEPVKIFVQGGSNRDTLHDWVIAQDLGFPVDVVSELKKDEHVGIAIMTNDYWESIPTDSELATYPGRMIALCF